MSIIKSKRNPFECYSGFKKEVINCFHNSQRFAIKAGITSTYLIVNTNHLKVTKQELIFRIKAIAIVKSSNLDPLLDYSLLTCIRMEVIFMSYLFMTFLVNDDGYSDFIHVH
jgi:hypothetical protein